MSRKVEQINYGKRWRSSMNSLVARVNQLNQIDPSILEDQDPPHLHIELEIVSLDFAGQEIVCQPVGATGFETYPVKLPQLYVETARGPVSYVYTDLNTRTASGAAGPDETQLLTPPLTVGEVIPVTWRTDRYVMDGDGRMWGVDPP